VTPASFKWQGDTLDSRTKDAVDAVTGEHKEVASTDNASYLAKKVMFQGGRTALRILAASNDNKHNPRTLLQNIAGAYGTFSLGEGNSFDLRIKHLSKQSFITRMKDRYFTLFEHRKQILNAQELATLWHPPGACACGDKKYCLGKNTRW
jgi:hypothetical protein